LCRQLATKRLRLDVVRESLDAVDLHDRDQLPIARLQLRIPGDVDLSQVEVELVAEAGERLLRPLAEVAPRRVIEDDFRYGYRPLVVVASATRWTASP
jgi:hypothetical protein